MKKIGILVSVVLIILSVGCTSDNDITLSEYVDVYKNAGHGVDINEKPAYTFIDAIDGVIFYIDNKKVAIYEYESKKDLEAVDFKFDATNGRFGLETSNKEAIEIFLNPDNISDEKDNDESHENSENTDVEEPKGAKLSDFVEAFEAFGYTVDANEKPSYTYVDAIDGVIFYVENQKIAIYEYESSEDINKVDFKFDAINGRFALETESYKAEEVFVVVGTENYEKKLNEYKNGETNNVQSSTDTSSTKDKRDDVNPIVGILQMTYDEIVSEFGSDYDELEFGGSYMLDYRSTGHQMMIGFQSVDFSGKSIPSVMYRYDINEFASSLGITGTVLPSKILNFFGTPEYQGYDEMGEFGYLITYDATEFEGLGYWFTFISEDEDSEITAMEFRLE